MYVRKTFFLTQVFLSPEYFKYHDNLHSKQYCQKEKYDFKYTMSKCFSASPQLLMCRKTTLKNST